MYIFVLLITFLAIAWVFKPYYSNSRWWCKKVRKHGIFCYDHPKLIELNKGIGKFRCKRCDTIFLYKISRFDYDLIKKENEEYEQ